MGLTVRKVNSSNKPAATQVLVRGLGLLPVLVPASLHVPYCIVLYKDQEMKVYYEDISSDNRTQAAFYGRHDHQRSVDKLRIGDIWDKVQ
jgi:hypothetical protein